jgi:F-box domain
MRNSSWINTFYSRVATMSDDEPEEAESHGQGMVVSRTAWSEVAFGKRGLSSEDMPPFLGLPFDVWAQVLAFLTASDRQVVSLVSRAARALVLCHVGNVRLKPLWRFTRQQERDTVSFLKLNCPFVRKLTIPGTMATNQSLRELPPSLRELSVECGYDLTADVLAALPPFLVTLRIGGCFGLGETCLERLSKSSIKELDLNLLPPEIVCRDTLKHLRPDIRVLDLTRCSGVVSGALAFLPAKLERLSLDKTSVTSLAGLPQTLKWLSVRQCPSVLSGIEYLPAGLEFLDLSGNMALQRPISLPANLRTLIIDFLPMREELAGANNLRTIFVRTPEYRSRSSEWRKGLVELTGIFADIVPIRDAASRFSVWNFERAW